MRHESILTQPMRLLQPSCAQLRPAPPPSVRCQVLLVCAGSISCVSGEMSPSWAAFLLTLKLDAFHVAPGSTRSVGRS